MFKDENRRQKHKKPRKTVESGITKEAFFPDAKLDPISGLYEVGQTIPLGRRIEEPADKEPEEPGARRIKVRKIGGASIIAVGIGGAAAGLLVGALASDGPEAPYPGNMTEFQGELPHGYLDNPAGFELIGGELIPKEEQGTSPGPAK